jgi:hypothetical protein
VKSVSKTLQDPTKTKLAPPCLVCRQTVSTEWLMVTAHDENGQPAGSLHYCGATCLARSMERYMRVTEPKRVQTRERVRQFRARLAALTSAA